MLFNSIPYSEEGSAELTSLSAFSILLFRNDKRLYFLKNSKTASV